MASKFEGVLREFFANEVGRLQTQMQEFQEGVRQEIAQKADRHELQELTRHIVQLNAKHNEGMQRISAAALASVIAGPVPAQEAPPAPLAPLDVGGPGAACAADPDVAPAASGQPCTTRAEAGSSGGLSAAEACGFEIVQSGTALEQEEDDEKEEARAVDEKHKESEREKENEKEEEEESDIAVEVAGLATALEEPPIAVGLLFPGLLFPGLKYVKMTTGVMDIPKVLDIPKVKDYLNTANHVLGWDVLQLWSEGPESKLEESRYCQPFMFVAGMAALEKLRAERREAADRFMVTAGLGVGEYTALCAAGVFSFEDGLRLVNVRGRAMQETVQACAQAGLSVTGLEKQQLQALCAEASKRAGGVCQISAELFPKGFTCAGSERAILILKGMSERAGALQAKVLGGMRALNSPLMAPAVEELGKALDEMLPRMSPPKQGVCMNATGTQIEPGTDPREVVGLLKRQLTSCVLWEPSVRAMIKAGVSEFYEAGPTNEIKAMLKRIDSKAWGTTMTVET